MNKLSYFAVAGLLVSSAAYAGWGDRVKETETVERSATFTGGTVSARTTNGAIIVSTWSGSEIEVVATKRAHGSDEAEAKRMLRETEVVIEPSGAGMAIDVRAPKSRRGSGISVELEIMLPRTANLELRTMNGAIRATEVDGDVSARTTNGSIKLADIAGQVDVETTNGSVVLRSISGSVDASTTNGQVDAELAVVDGPGKLSTVNGSVELRLADGTAVSIEAQTSNGRVRGDLVQGRTDRRERRASFDVNGGGPLYRLKASNGSVRVNRL